MPSTRLQNILKSVSRQQGNLRLKIGWKVWLCFWLWEEIVSLSNFYPSHLQDTDNLHFSISALVPLAMDSLNEILISVTCQECFGTLTSACGHQLLSLEPKFRSAERFSWSDLCISWQLLQHLPVAAGNVWQSQGADSRRHDLTHHVPLIGNRHLDVCTICKRRQRLHHRAQSSHI